VKTRVIQIDPGHPASAELEAAAQCLRDGGLVAFPTETVYGLGANALDADALAKIFVAKQRPRSDPIIAHIAELEQLQELAVEIPDTTWRLTKAFWPGPLTLILKRHPAVPDLIAEGRDTVAVRMPAHPIARELLRLTRRPVGAPSANRFTRPSATSAAHVLEDLDGRIDMVIDGGPATIGVESTVLDLSSAQPTVLRPGGLALEDLQSVVPEAVYRPAHVTAHEGHQSPGQLIKHYSPRASVHLFRGIDRGAVLDRMAETASLEAGQGRRVGALLTEEDARDLQADAAIEFLGPAVDPEAQAKVLFAALRNLDARGVDVILVREPAGAGLERALADRLLRAAEGRVVEV
jgi:L-threonylcarbamoyladenylate synthase